MVNGFVCGSCTLLEKKNYRLDSYFLLFVSFDFSFYCRMCRWFLCHLKQKIIDWVLISCSPSHLTFPSITGCVGGFVLFVVFCRSCDSCRKITIKFDFSLELLCFSFSERFLPCEIDIPDPHQYF